MKAHQNKNQAGFSLIELVIVVVIIGIIGAIAIPRMSRGAAGAADSALVANLSVLRNAVDLYSTEHGGEFPSLTSIEDQLLTYTDAAGNTSATKEAPFIYGPYLRSVPGVPVGPQRGENGFTGTADPETAAGWVYDEDTGEIRANTGDAADDAGSLYREY